MNIEWHVRVKCINKGKRQQTKIKTKHTKNEKKEIERMSERKKNNLTMSKSAMRHSFYAKTNRGK